MTHELEVIENAVLETLAPLRNSGLRWLGPYAGQFEEEAALSQLRFPFVLVGAWRLVIEPGNRYDHARAEVHLWVGGHSPRGPQTVLSTSPGGIPGIRSILASIRETLNGIQVIPGWSALAWQEETAVILSARNSITVYEARYVTRRPIGRD